MLPDKNNVKWKMLINGDIKHTFKVVSAGLLLSRLQREIKKDNSKENYEKCIDEAYNFFTRFEKLFVEDFKTIF
jgi:hypothetical protein